MTVGERIKKRRKELDINADTIADELGVSRSTIFRYEKGAIEKLPVDVLEPIASVLRTTPAYLMGWDDDPTDYDDPHIVADNAGDLLDALDGDVKAAVAVRQAIEQDVLNERYATSNTDAIVDLFEKVKHSCDSRNITIAKLECKMGFKKGTIKSWGSSAPSANLLAKVADYFNVSTDYLLGRTDNPSPIGEISAASRRGNDASDLPTEALEKLKSYEAFLRNEYKK